MEDIVSKLTKLMTSKEGVFYFSLLVIFLTLMFKNEKDFHPFSWELSQSLNQEDWINEERVTMFVVLISWH